MSTSDVFLCRSATAQRFAPPSPSLRRVTSEPPPIPPRTPESQRKPLLVRLASEPVVVEGLDLQTVNGRVTVVGAKQVTSTTCLKLAVDSDRSLQFFPRPRIQR